MNELKIRDPNYPDSLKNIFNPPSVLYFKGNLKSLDKLAISIVGTRKYSEYGEYLTKKIIKELSVYDLCIISGLALGIDTFAHQAALDSGLTTIAVLGSGIENIFPRANIRLAKNIEDSGLILSEHPGKTPGLAHHFPLRNRIVSALSIATLVIEAPERSGALITANLALEQGKDIFVVPGDIDRVNSKGCLRLLQKSVAYPVSSGDDIINFLKDQNIISTNQDQQPKLPKINLNLSPTESKIYDRIKSDHHSNLDQLHFKTKIPVPRLLSAISMLEVYDLIRSSNGTYYQKE